MAKKSKSFVTWVGRDEDVGITDFQFSVDGREYVVRPKPAGEFKSQDFINYIQGVCRRTGISPFTYKHKDLFEIEPKGQKPGDKPGAGEEGEQISLKFARKIERLASELQERGLPRVAEMLKPLALRFRKAWLGPKSIAFFDDLGNANIQPEDAMQVMEAYESGMAEGDQIAEATGLGKGLCVKVVDLAKRHLLDA